MSKQAKITDLLSDYASKQVLNTNFENLNEALDNTISLDGSAPNSMGADFDMNGHRVLNVPAPEAPTDLLRLEDLSGLDLQVSLINTPPTTAVVASVATIIATDFTGYNFIYTEGYATPGDGGAASYKLVPFKPSHSCYWTDAAGQFWEIAEAEIDPRMFGAKADVFMFSQGTISAGNLSQIVVNDTTSTVGNQGFVGFVTGDIGKNIVLWDYPCAHTLANTTIASLSSTTVAGLTGSFSLGTKVITMANTTGVTPYMVVSDVTHSTFIPANCIVLSVVANVSITVSEALLGTGAGDTLSFTIQNRANLTAPASGATTGNSLGFFGTDDSSSISTCMTAAQRGLSGFSEGPPPSAFPNSSAFNTAASGGHVIRFRSLDQNTSRYGIAVPVLLTNNVTLKWDENACLFALGNFTTNSAMITQDGSAGYNPIFATLDNAKLQGNGFAAIGCLPVYTNFFTIKNGYVAINCTLYGLQLGIAGTQKVSTVSVNGKVHIEGISTTMPGYINNASGVGIFIHNAPDSKFAGDVEIINYRTGININNGDLKFLGPVHIWTNVNGGYFTTGVSLTGSDILFSDLLIDSLWGPDSSTLCVGANINGIANNINHLAIDINVAAAPTVDNTVTAVVYGNTNFVPSSNLELLGSRINSIYTQSSTSAVKLSSIVDGSASSNLLLDVGTITTDGNVYTLGYPTQTKKCQLSIKANTVSSANLLTDLAQHVAAPLWYPSENAGNIPFWLDASGIEPGSYLSIVNNVAVTGMFSRLGPNMALQGNLARAPSIGATAWAGTNITSQQAVSFNGTNNFMLLDDVIFNKPDVRVFLAYIPNTTGAFGPVFGFNNLNQFGGLLRQTGSGTAIAATDTNAGGTNNTPLTAGTPVLISAIWSQSFYGGTGSTVRTNGGTNATINSLVAANIPVCMGALITNNIVSQPVSFVLAEMIVVTSAMVLAQEQKYEGYLAWKWWNATAGHSPILPNTHPYYSAAPTA